MYFGLLIVNISNSIFKSLFHIYFIVKDFFLCFSGCISNSDSGDDSTETQTLKFCEPFQGELSNTKAGITFQVYKVNSAIKLFFLFSASRSIWDHSVFEHVLYSYKEILQIENAYAL